MSNVIADASAPPVLTTALARRGLGVYLVVVAALSVPLYVGMIRTDAFAGEKLGLAWLAPFMMVPAAASVVARLLLHEGFADLSRKRRTAVSRRVTRRAVLLPVVVGVPAYAVAWASGLITVDVPAVGTWVGLVLVNLLMNVVLVTGEELGWRGYMVPRLLASGVAAPLVVGGLIWGAWHVPLYVWAGIVEDGPDPALQTVLLLALTTALGYVLGRLQLVTATVWAPVALHVAWNVFLQTVLDPLATGADKYLWVGEVGLLTVGFTVLVASAYARRPWGMALPTADPGGAARPARSTGEAPSTSAHPLHRRQAQS
jgi:membrane protease YdiL (CAAX protease family)